MCVVRGVAGHAILQSVQWIKQWGHTALPLTCTAEENCVMRACHSVVRHAWKWPGRPRTCAPAGGTRYLQRPRWRPCCRGGLKRFRLVVPARPASPACRSAVSLYSHYQLLSALMHHVQFRHPQETSTSLLTLINLHEESINLCCM
jgi:hypothetical protein